MLAAQQKRNPGLAINATSLFAGLPQFIDGGPTGGGGLAMLHPGEFVVPKDGTLVGGGGSQVINLVVDGRVLATVVNDVNTRSMKQGRQFPGS